MANTTLHQETLARLGLTRPLESYTETKCIAQEIANARKTVTQSNFERAKLMLASQPGLNPHLALLSAAESTVNG